MLKRYTADSKEYFCRLLDLGAMECSKYRMVTTEDREEKIRIPVTALLIHHPTLGNVLYDTGNAEDWQTELFEDTRKNFPIVEYRSLREALAEEGLEPADIQWLILSHLHFDHAGSIRIFAGTEAGAHVLVGRKEYERAVKSVREHIGTAYVEQQFLVEGIHYEMVDGDREMAPDLKLFLQTSHSPAMIGLELDRPGFRPLLCVSDSIYLRENYEKELPPDSPNRANAGGFAENLHYIKEKQKSLGAEILFGHDMEQAKNASAELGL